LRYWSGEGDKRDGEKEGGRVCKGYRDPCRRKGIRGDRGMREQQTEGKNAGGDRGVGVQRLRE